MLTPLHPRTQSHRRARVLPCKRNHRPSRHITSTTRLMGILRIGHRIPRGPTIHPRHRPVRLRRLSVRARLRLESSRTSRRGKRAKIAWRHRRGDCRPSSVLSPQSSIRSSFTAIYHDYCTCGIFFSLELLPFLCSFYLLFAIASSPFPHPLPPCLRAFLLLLGSPHMHCHCSCLGLSLLDVHPFRHKRSVIISVGTLELATYVYFTARVPLFFAEMKLKYKPACPCFFFFTCRSVLRDRLKAALP